MINEIPKYNGIQHVNWSTNVGPSVPSFDTKKNKKLDPRYLEIAKHYKALAKLFEELAEEDV